MEIFDFIKILEIPVVVVDIFGNIVCCNRYFKNIFGSNAVENKFKIFQNSFNIENCCMLNPNNISDFNPIKLAVDSDCNFSTIATYQNSEDEFFTFFISSTKMNDYYIIKFFDKTNEQKLKELKSEYNKINIELINIKKEITLSLETKDKAQNQAIKMALLNRIFEALGSSIDINTTLSNSFKELSEIFGFSKVLYAQKVNNDTYKIKNIYPEKSCNENTDILNIENKNLEKLKSNKFVITNVVNHTYDKNTVVKTDCRIYIPIFQTNSLIGIIFADFPRQNFDKISEDMINAISAQFSGAIIQANLFEEINNKNEQLQKAYTKLEQTQLQLINSEKMASLGQLVAGVAHEINTPLASINSNNSIFEKILKMDEFDSDIIDTLKSMIETDKEAIKRISNIVKSLKRFVRLDEAELQNANINNEIDLTLELLKHETKNKIEIVKNYTNNDEIKCYPNLLNQVFMNILMNAIQSMENGGKIYIATENMNSELIIKIKDTGSGMDENTKAKIFKSGFTTKKIGIGTGLGLMISKDIIKKHNGDISFTSNIGVGTEFKISIPIIK